MKNLFFFTLIGFLGYMLSSASEIRRELPIGTEFSIKTDFWVYEIKGRRPYAKDNYYVMNSDRGKGIGGAKFKYRTTFPLGTRFEVISLVKKNKQEWIYIVKPKGYADPRIGEATIAIFPLSMLEELWGKPVKFFLQPTQTTRLDPDLFANFIYPMQ